MQDSQLGPNGVLYREVPLYLYTVVAGLNDWCLPLEWYGPVGWSVKTSAPCVCSSCDSEALSHRHTAVELPTLCCCHCLLLIHRVDCMSWAMSSKDPSIRRCVGGCDV